MTSRARRIVLAMYGHREFTPVPQTVVADSSVYWMGTHGCYEAMDDVEEWEIDNLTESEPYGVNLLASPIVGGNYGLPCA